MPERQTITRAKRLLRRGKSASTAAGEFVREEIHHVREGKHGARSTKQAIAIGLSKARRAGVPLGTPKRQPRRIRRQASADLRAGRLHKAPSKTRSKATLEALQHEPHRAATRKALSKQARRSAKQRGPAARSRAAKKAAATRRKHAT